MFNSSVNVYKTEWLEIVFSGRNKSYGAYALRSQSSSILTKSLFIASSAFVLFFAAPMVYQKFNPQPIVETGKVIKLDNPVYSMKKEEMPIKKEEVKKADPVKVKTIAVPSKIVVAQDPVLPPPTMDDMKHAVISSVTQDGETRPDLVIPINTGKGEGDGKGTETGTSNGNEINDLSGIDEYPEFVGGMKAWSKYMERNLRYPYQAQEEGAKGKVFVSFVVERDGSITDVKVLKGIGYGCDEEAVKVIKKSPLWKAGKNKGVPVRVRYNMAINFTMN